MDMNGVEPSEKCEHRIQSVLKDLVLAARKRCGGFDIVWLDMRAGTPESISVFVQVGRETAR